MRRLHRNRRQRFKLMPIAVVAMAGLIGLWILWYLISLLNFSSTLQTSFTLSSTTPEQVSVQIGTDWKQNVTDIKLYAENQVRTNNGYATMFNTEGELVVLSTNADMKIVSSTKNEAQIEWTLALTDGSMFVRTLPNTIATKRIIELQGFRVEVPNESELMVTPNSVLVLHDNSAGAQLWFPSLNEPVLVGEGQSFMLPADADTTDISALYAIRTAIDAAQLTGNELLTHVAATNTPAVEIGTASLLTVTEPQDNAEIITPTTLVTGEVDPTVVSVEVNGNIVPIQSNKTFRVDIAVPIGTFTITTVAKNTDSIIITQDVRTVTRTAGAPENSLSIQITEPVAGGLTFTTAADAVAIRGTASANVAKIFVNDYVLQLYTPGQKNWQYIADTALRNFTIGTNIYKVTAQSADGTVSAPVTITIVKSASSVNLQSSTSSKASAISSTVSIVNTNQTAQIVRTGPTADAQYTTTNSEVIIEGTIRGRAESVWVNGYQLQLFNPQRGIWNYLANTKLNTLAAGTNTYKIEARDAAGAILDTNTLTINYTPNS